MTRFQFADGMQAGVALLRTGLPRAWAPVACSIAATLLGSSLTLLGHPIWYFVVMLLTIPFHVIAWSSMLRLATLGPQGRPIGDLGPAGFQWRTFEWRQLAVFSVTLPFVLLMLGLPQALFIYKLGDFVWMVQYPMQLEGTFVASDMLLWAFCVFVYVTLSFGPYLAFVVMTSLTGPATAARGRVTIWSAVRIVKGGYWPVLLGALVLNSLWILSSVGPLLIPASADAMFDGSQVSLRTVVTWIFAMVDGVSDIVILPLEAGFLAEAYRRLSAKAQDAF